MTDKKKTAFEKALTDAVLARYQKTIAEDSEPVVLSDSYKKAIEGLTKKTERRTWKFVNKTWKRILIAAILMFLLAATAVAAVPALREGLIRFFTHDNGVAYTFEFTQEDLDRAPKEIETYYVPSYVPNGFALVDQNVISSSLDYIYYNDVGQALVYNQSALWTVANDSINADSILTGLTIDSENVFVEDAVLQGYEVKIIQKLFQTLGQNHVETVAVWTDHKYFYRVSSPNLDVTELERIIASLTIIDPS